ncbi:hypothetical protein CHBNIII6_08480 [Haemophilus influenzae]|nr:hypothetical protein CHBNIII6_08480 [Haemophilus influenzae]
MTKYLDQTVLDLQFGHSQRTGYALGEHILRHFAKVTILSRSTPQHASLGVLRSPDIPSVLVETGFLSNSEEEKKLNSQAYRRRIAYMIYEGLVAFRSGKTNALVKDNLVQNIKQNDIKKSGKNNRTSEQNINEDNIKDSGIRHIVKKGESLGSLSNKYHVKVSDIIKLNQLKRKTLWLNESIKIPDNGDIKNIIPLYHKVTKNQTLYAISREYNIPVNILLSLNPHLKNGKVITGQKN